MSAAGGRESKAEGVYTVVLVRHGLSTFNKFDMFTGWCDCPLSEEGMEEAAESGRLLAAAGLKFDVAHTSVLKRACTSLHRMLEGAAQPWVPIKTSWMLNERHYGALQGQNKAATEQRLGPIVHEWRRGYAVAPPPMEESHPHWTLIQQDARYAGVDIPLSESLRDTAQRVLKYWRAEVVPDVLAGKKVLVVAHANTLRALVHALDGIDDEAIKGLKIPTGRPFIYKLDANLQPVGEVDRHGFRGRYVDTLMQRNPRYVVQRCSSHGGTSCALK
ncbi:histidine phosphatase superfamily [Tribonema minus]|uniref:phosphoglycerate mutase (2,3-diphosphoglycerate-dependent) n=1 Tax=Tribonema minus TaxID=303371 RepID=A0A836CDH1_9STRA|nr:histidine phosphatase superfamily [Tribonema minus]